MHLPLGDQREAPNSRARVQEEGEEASARVPGVLVLAGGPTDMIDAEAARTRTQGRPMPEIERRMTVVLARCRAQPLDGRQVRMDQDGYREDGGDRVGSPREGEGPKSDEAMEVDPDDDEVGFIDVESGRIIIEWPRATQRE